MKKHILEIDSVQKRYANQSVLSDVYLKCETNDIIGLLGRNGSGKSTLLKIIFGVENADFKFIRINGEVKNRSNDVFKDISYLPQDNFIPNQFTVKNAVSLSVESNKVDDFYKDEIIQSFKNTRISNLSGGELRYLEIKLILYNPSKFVLLDEPYNGLSPLMIENVNELIRKNSKLKGIILTDHNYENIILVSSKLILMKEGKTYHLNDKNELIDMGYLNEGMI